MSSAWKGKTAGLDRSAQGRTAYFVQLSGQSALDAGSLGGNKTAPSKVLAQRSLIAGTADRAFAAARTADSSAVKLYTVTNLVPGFAVQTTPAGVRALAARSDVVKVSRIIAKTTTNANTANLVHALQTWKYPGGTGKGVKIGIIDTGLDYTHADFGGKGTAAAYNAALATDTAGGWRAALPKLGKAKIFGGYDLVGDNYDPDPSSADYQPVPNPDPNPLDCNEHGSHVAGTAAGYGEGKSGNTFTGSYAALDAQKLLNLKIGPGMAPNAKLYSLKVFGCSGSTDVVIAALDRAVDPNQDGDTSDHFDMINMSLGSDDGVVDDPENLVVNRLAKKGVLPVISIGNGGDETDIGGSPGNAVASLAVASSVDSYQLRDGIKVNRPSSKAGVAPGQFSVAYDWPNNGPSGQPVTGDVAAIPGTFGSGNTDGCDPLTPTETAAVAGKVAWLYWDDNDSTRQCGSAARSANVEAAGAIGSIFTSGLDVFGAGITGSATIPVIQLPKAQTDRLQPAVTAGTLNVTFNGKFQSTIKDITPSISDTLSSFSSRGEHGAIGVVKPDVTAPGDTIASAGMGTGNKTLVISGTSMASPLVAGVSALVKGEHPTWGPLKIKAAVMNTATHDLWTGQSKSGHRYAPARVGSGRVDARRAVKTKVLAYTKGADNRVSASFGVVPVSIDGGKVTKKRTLVVRNLSKKETTFTLGYDAVNPSPGVRYSFSRHQVTVAGHHGAKVRVKMTVTPTALRHKIDPTMDSEQSLAPGFALPRQFVSDSSGHLTVKPAHRKAIRVPVYGAAKPTSHTNATAQAGEIDLTGTGIAQGSGSRAYNSIVSVMAHGTTSPAQAKCSSTVTTDCWVNQSAHAGDIRYDGAGSVGDSLWFGISTRHNWATNNTMTPYVDVDTGGSPAPDFELFVQNFNTGSSRTDVLLVYTVDFKTGDIIDIEAANFELGDVDTNVFDTNTILLPVSRTALNGAGIDLTGADSPITYWAGTFNGYTGDNQDYTGPATFNVGTPSLSADSPLYDDQGATSIPVTGSGSALVFHLHGATGKRDQLVTVP